MKCCEFEYKVFEFSEGELDGFEKEKTEKHLEECEECRKAYNSYKKISADIHGFYKNIDLERSEPKNKKESAVVNSFIKPQWILPAIFTVLIAAVIYIFPDWHAEGEVYLADSTVTAGHVEAPRENIHWDVEVYTITNKIEMIRDQLNKSTF